MSDVFISYSRRDKDFVRQLFETLEQHGHDTWVDWDDIEYAEDWWRKICAGIEEADNFVFIMTPDSIRSKICFDEVNHAVKANKRIIPVLHREVTEDADQQRMHPALQRHNWLPMPDQVTEDSVSVLLETIAREPEHVRAHTRFLVRAREWSRAERNASLLLRGDDLQQAEAWLAASVNRTPGPTQQHAEYINASRIAERKRQRGLFAGVATALVVAIGLAILSFALFQQSEERRQVSEQRGTAVAEQAATATVALGEAEINLRSAWETQSRLLADFSRQELAAGNVQTALLLALEALSHSDAGIVNLENSSALRNVLAYPGERLYMAHDDIVWNATWNDNASQILSFSADNSARLWDARSGEERWRLAHDDSVIGASWNSDFSQILTASGDGTARTWDVATGENVLTLEHDSGVWGAIWFDDDNHIMTVENQFDETGGGQNRGAVHFWDADGSALMTLEHDNLVRFAWVNQEAGQVLTSCDDGVARIWDIETGELLVSMEDEFAVWRAIYNEDRSLVLTMSREVQPTGEVGAGSSVRIWDAETGESLHSLPYEGTPSFFPRWNSDGTRVMTMSVDAAQETGMVQVWDAATGEDLLALRHRPAGSDQSISNLAALWNSDESRILSWVGTTLRVWDTTTGEVLRTMQHEANLWGAVWSKDDSRVLAWDSEGLIQVWDLATQQAITTLSHEDLVQGATWNEDESAILSWSYDGSIRLWDVANPAEMLALNYDTPFAEATWNPDGSQVAAWSGPTAAVWDVEAGERIITIEHDGETVHGMAWNAAGSQILSWGRDGMARFWDAEDGSAITALAHDDVVLDAAWSHDETRLLTLTLDGLLYVWDLESESKSFPALRYTSERTGGAAWRPDDAQILSWSSSDEHLVQIWDAATGETVASLEADPGFMGAAWNLAGTRILIWDNDDTALIWDPAADTTVTLQQVTRRADLENFDDEITGGQWSADGSRVLTWTIYGDVRIWDASDGSELMAVDDCGNHVQWSANETRLLCGTNFSENPAVRVWDLARAETILEYPVTLEGQLDGVAWNADETRFLAWKILDGSLTVWNGDLDELIAIAQQRSYRSLSADERTRFFLPPATPSGS